jgi:hypothetical protein
MGGIDGLLPDFDDFFMVVTVVSVNQTSVWEVTSQTDDTLGTTPSGLQLP